MVPRNVYISKEDCELYGYTERCPGCVSMLKGTARQMHTEACRRRMEAELAGTRKALRAKRKVGDYQDKKEAAEKEDMKKRMDGKRMAEEMEDGRRFDEDDKKMEA